MLTTQVFQRYEKKYLLTPAQYRALSPALSPHLEQDEYGLHTISNLYYDTDSYALIRHSLDKPVYKEKLRLRSYGTPRSGDPVYAEIKKKFRGIVHKRRAALSHTQAVAFLAGGGLEMDGQVLREIQWMLDFYRPEPKVMLAYDRVALRGRQDPELRVTLDQNIRWRDTVLDLRRGSWGEALISQDLVLMEVKVPQAFPLWLTSLLSDLRVFPTSFSKYGVCYQNHLMPAQRRVIGGIAHAS